MYVRAFRIDCKILNLKSRITELESARDKDKFMKTTNDLDLSSDLKTGLSFAALFGRDLNARGHRRGYQRVDHDPYRSAIPSRRDSAITSSRARKSSVQCFGHHCREPEPNNRGPLAGVDGAQGTTFSDSENVFDVKTSGSRTASESSPHETVQATKTTLTTNMTPSPAASQTGSPAGMIQGNNLEENNDVNSAFDCLFR